MSEFPPLPARATVLAILLVCTDCGGRYIAGSVEALLTKRCLCGGQLAAPTAPGIQVEQ